MTGRRLPGKAEQRCPRPPITRVLWPESLCLPQVQVFKPWFPVWWYLEDRVWGLDEVPRVEPP